MTTSLVMPSGPGAFALLTVLQQAWKILWSRMCSESHCLFTRSVASVHSCIGSSVSIPRLRLDFGPFFWEVYPIFDACRCLLLVPEDCFSYCAHSIRTGSDSTGDRVEHSF
jgi:hypothetical protein